MVELLLSKGANVNQRNGRNETPINSVSGELNEGLIGFYRSLNNSTESKVDLRTIKETRAKLAKFMREHSAKRR